MVSSSSSLRAMGCSGLLTLSLAAAALPAWAGAYRALCGGANCVVTVTPEVIQSPFGAIPPSRVTYWGSTGESKTSVGTGVATTVLFGGIGLLGFLAKNHQYNFTINGFDQQGRKITMQIEFKNDKPAKQLMGELAALTGLGMGQTRTAEEILATEQGQTQLLSLPPKQQASPTLGPMKAQQAQLKPATNCWSTYLKNNPAMQTWADANPTQAAQNKKRFDAC